MMTKSISEMVMAIISQPFYMRMIEERPPTKKEGLIGLLSMFGDIRHKMA